MNSTYIMIAVGVLVAIIAAVAVYYFFFTETEEQKKEKDAKEFVNKLKILKEEKKPFTEFMAVKSEFDKKYPKFDEKMKDPAFSSKFEELMKKEDKSEVVKYLVSVM